MAVTEIAILHFNTPTHGEDVRQRLKQAQSVQEVWHTKHFPHLPSSRVERGDAMFEQLEDPARVLITARWDSVAAHWQWIGGDENKKIMAGLGDYIDSNNVVLFHLDDADIFSGPAPQGMNRLTESPVISVARMFVSPEAKHLFSVKFEEVRSILEDFAKPHLVRGGWRVDKEGDAKEEFVIFCGWESLEKHTEFKMHPAYSDYIKLLEFATGADMKHYKRIL